MKSILNITAFLCGILFYCTYGNTAFQDPVYPISKKSETQLLNGSWDFKYIAGGEIPDKDKNFYQRDFIGKDWRKIDVPSNWETQGIVEPSYADPKEGVGLYRTTFSVPKKFTDGNDTFIRFEGVLYAYVIYVNGEFVGNDGIVYSNRHPQSDYWLVRKVYSPIWISTDEIDLQEGKQEINIEVENRFDFISLDGFTCKWSLKHYQNELSGGNVRLDTPPNSTGSFAVPVAIPDGTTGELNLSLNFFDASGMAVYEKTIKIMGAESASEPESGSSQKVKKNSNKKAKIFTITSEEISFSVDGEGRVLLVNGSANDTLLNGHPILRVGRKPTITLAYQAKAKRLNPEENKQFYWNPYLLRTPTLISKEIQKTDDGYQIKATYQWQRQEMENESVEGAVIFKMAPGGTVTCAYDLKPINATGLFMEFGLGFSLPKEYTTFRWLGDGPFVSVPGKTYYNERDIWALDKEDIRFTGNRAHTDLAAFYKHPDGGIGFMGSDSNFAVERVDDHIIFNHNALVSGFGTKVKFTRHPVKANEQKTIKGSFKIRVLGKNSGTFNEVFLPLKKVEVEKPFLKSYGF